MLTKEALKQIEIEKGLAAIEAITEKKALTEGEYGIKEGSVISKVTRTSKNPS